MAAQARLVEERKDWRKDHPPGMVAKPATRSDGSTNMFEWECKVPGLKDTFCEGGMFPLTIKFSPEHPHKPPRVYMPRGFFHVNVFEDGGVCLSILKEVVPGHLGDVSGWRPNFTVKTILVAIQELLSNPNFGSVANMQVHAMKKRSQKEYLRQMREQTTKYTPKDDES
ncbi:hypothetical protein VOLCADRAFT_81731 [Volvox carteri f. nagariensis]|uniref:UBC core domain-containing protein n=1 Tax=Volvox carteri f. nagariensis TaxID=3068 RepID=D8U0B4_VOLCA|nr:uncharacterized protein VOLCADRAFT_81731 [Volvox carteri f. nagariensis]EFJ46833.1 hypothetical protein VOLCADRAFT_81731 [Volvox carteri f. nagariensis]|eukprot:XP_002952042.1 hypothetical protein VOLCADRAFT_81731 [Volvox carteri f. nagariensis]